MPEPALIGAPRQRLESTRPLPAGPDRPTGRGPWWRSAVIYEVYLRSFADADGDGTGDLAGVRSRLPYLHALGVDAIWFTPWYVSPLADGGYDVADYRAIDPAFGTLAEAEALIAEARALGIRTIVDIVPNHVSDRHPWFQAALAGGAGLARARALLVPTGRGADGESPPTGWRSEFRGVPWTRTTNPDGTPGDWYLHLFTPEQPDLNWDHPDVRAEHEDILRFWFDRGAGGVRIDSAALLVKDPALPEVPGGPGARPPPEHRPRRAPRHLPLVARRRGHLPGRPRARRRDLAARSSASRSTSGRTSCTRPSTSTSWPGRGTRRAWPPRSTRPSPSTPPSARRPPGSCPTTTSPGR